MQFLLDANVEYRLATFLTSLGHDVKTIARDYPHSLTDHEVLALATDAQRILRCHTESCVTAHFRKARKLGPEWV